MAKTTLKAYSDEIEAAMYLHFTHLSEKDQRHYAAIEALKLGHGGITYISKVLKITRYRIRTGIKELLNKGLLDQIPLGKQRRSGGGRKKNSLRGSIANNYML